MRRIGRYTFGVGFGAFLLATVGGQATPQAAQLAGAAVAIGWLFWGVLALQGEFGAVASGAARFAFDAAGALFARPGSDRYMLRNAYDENSSRLENSPETLPAAPATRYIRINDANGSRWLAVDDGPRGDYRRQVVSFLILGERVGFKWRDMENRSLPGRLRVDFPLWQKLSDDLVGAGVMLKDRKNGTRLALGLRDALARLATGAPLAGEPRDGIIVN